MKSSPVLTLAVLVATTSYSAFAASSRVLSCESESQKGVKYLVDVEMKGKYLGNLMVQKVVRNSRGTTTYNQLEIPVKIDRLEFSEKTIFEDEEGSVSLVVSAGGGLNDEYSGLFESRELRLRPLFVTCA